MGQRERRVYLDSIRVRYKSSDRATKKQILNEFCAVCGYNRKYAIGLLNKPRKHSKKRRGRKATYNNQCFLTILQRIWMASDFMCSGRLKTVIPMWLPYYEQEHKPVDDKTRAQLLSVSAATIDRVLKPLRARYRKGLCGTVAAQSNTDKSRKLGHRLAGVHGG